MALIVLPRLGVILVVAAITLGPRVSGRAAGHFRGDARLRKPGACRCRGADLCHGRKNDAAVPRFARRCPQPVAGQLATGPFGGLRVILYMRVDQVMLGTMASADELGRYSIAVRVADVALIVPVALHASLFASVVRAQERGPEALVRHMQLVYDAMLVATLATAVLMAGASLLFFGPLFGSAYLGGLPMTLILLLGLPWSGLGTARSAELVVRGWLWSSPATTGLGAVANILLNLLLIPKFGGQGAAWATVFSYWLAAHGSSFLLPHLRQTGVLMTRSPQSGGRRGATAPCLQERRTGMSGKTAPVALFVYNRPDQTRKTLAALLRNPPSSRTDVYVFADGIRRPDDRDKVARCAAWSPKPPGSGR